ncbi:hypothetical protein Pmani_024317 [Petrolisthes manimaculis]|uniref:Uncharacterized protein n=1 Tax=Petrolisthes manimaculis TaxID=1843537 RepID=A0AAE1P8H0_9EUCA|nr:hypothetical protein Pmani_024317 [Petrolisthes manimaculis]
MKEGRNEGGRRGPPNTPTIPSTQTKMTGVYPPPFQHFNPFQYSPPCSSTLLPPVPVLQHPSSIPPLSSTLTPCSSTSTPFQYPPPQFQYLFLTGMFSYSPG